MRFTQKQIELLYKTPPKIFSWMWGDTKLTYTLNKDKSSYNSRFDKPKDKPLDIRLDLLFDLEEKYDNFIKAVIEAYQKENFYDQMNEIINE